MWATTSRTPSHSAFTVSRTSLPANLSVAGPTTAPPPRTPTATTTRMPPSKPRATPARRTSPAPRSSTSPTRLPSACPKSTTRTSRSSAGALASSRTTSSRMGSPVWYAWFPSTPEIIFLPPSSAVRWLLRRRLRAVPDGHGLCCQGVPVEGRYPLVDRLDEQRVCAAAPTTRILGLISLSAAAMSASASSYTTTWQARRSPMTRTYTRVLPRSLD